MKLLLCGGVIFVFVALSACTLNVAGRLRDNDQTDADADTDADGDTGDCVPSLEACNGLDDDCDGEIDEDFDLQTDLDHCGQCDRPCLGDPPNASPTCESGLCTLECDRGFANCDDDIGSGCEANLTSSDTCGSCERRCTDPTPLCAQHADSTYECVSSCPDGTELCGASCIDTSQSTNHCGGCDNRCDSWAHASPICVNSVCGFECDEGFYDCDEVDATGCEDDLTSLENCGDCGDLCDPDNAVGSCVDRVCQIAYCDADFGDCSGGVDDGCETSLLTLSDCTACGVLCELPRADASCATGECLVATCSDGWDDCTAEDGCETQLGTESDCSGCGDDCTLDNAIGECVDGVCDIDECVEFYDNCNAYVPDGCEASLLDDPENCGWCSHRCLPIEECINGVCSTGICLPECDCDATCTTDDACDCSAGCLCDAMVCADDCSARCNGAGTMCMLDATSVSNLTPFFCGNGAMCWVDMSGSGGNLNSGERTCTGRDTACFINCEDASNCHPNCLDNARCVLRCEGASNCSFEDCWTTEDTCPGNVRVCGVDCDSI